MAKSIFDYDSSDDELSGYTSGSARKVRTGDHLFYDAGNAILHNKMVFKKYRDKKPYKTKPESKLVNKFLTNKVYAEDDKTYKSLSSFSAKQSKQEKKKLETFFQDSRNLYSKLEEVAGNFQKKDAVINSTKYIDVLDKLQNSDIEKTFYIQKAKIKAFKKSLGDIEGFKENIQKLKSFIDEFPAMKQLVQRSISQEEEPDYKSLVVMQNLCNAFKSDVNHLIEVKELYTYLEKLAGTQAYFTKDGTVNTVNLKCFDVLQKAASQKKLDNITKTSVANTWGIKKSKVEGFLSECKNKWGNFLELIECRSVFQGMNNVIQGKIQKFITASSHDMDFNFVLYLACNKELEGITHYLSQGDKQISDRIKELDFFSEGKGLQSDASEFLSKSLLCQKYLKTLAKFVSLRNLQGTDKHTVANKITISISKNHELDISNDFSSTSKRTEKVLTLGDYKNISKKLISALNGLSESAIGVVDLFKGILKGEVLYSEKSKNDTDHVKDLHDIVYLLFSCESNRNPSTLITNAMFLELVKNGIYGLNDMAEKMPMAIDGAIEIGRYFHHQNKKEKRVNDYGITKAKPKNTDQFIQREKELLEDWVEHCTTTEDINKEIQNLVLRWYGIGIRLKAAGETTEKYFSNDYDYISPIKALDETNNKYCSVVLKKLVDYKNHTSKILDFNYTELAQDKCIEIDNDVKLKLEEIKSKKDPLSKKRSFYEAFPEELQYSHIFEKRAKISEDKIIKHYYMPYCLANTELQIIDRLFWEGALHKQEVEDYITLNLNQYKPQREPFTEEKTRLSDTEYKSNLSINKQKENNIHTIQNKFMGFTLDSINANLG